jgi:Calx-beta domain
MRLCWIFLKTVFGLLAVMIASLTAHSPAFAASSNNNFANAIVLSGSGVITGSITATAPADDGETGEYVGAFPAGSGSPLNSVWYSWTAPASGVVSFGTCNPTGSSLTNFDTTIVVGTGAAVNAFTMVALNDDTTACNSVVNASYASTVTFNAVSGTTYMIQIDGYAATTGTFQLFYGFSGYTTVASATATSEAGATSSFTLVLNAVPSGTATITIGTSPQCTFSPSVLTFTSATWNTAQTVTVTAINDTVMEGPHFCAPSSITPSGGSVVGSSQPPPGFSVIDNDTTVNIANTTNGAEAGPVSGVFTVTQGGTLSVANTVNYTVAGTATSGTDYTALSGSVVIPAGSTSATIIVPVIDDAIVEAAETVIVTVTGDTAPLSTLGTTVATNTIAENDVATVSIARTTNGNEAGPVSTVFTVTQSAVSSTNTVINLTRSGTATLTSDYTSPSNTITIPAGSTTATITYPVVNDVAVEGDETLIVTMSSIASGLATLGTPVAATATIFDNDSPTVTIANTTNGTEVGPTNGTMTLTLSLVRTTNIVVAYTVTGTATSGTDYTALSGSATILAGSLTATLPIPVLDDAIVEGNETVIVTLTSVTSGAATIGAVVVATNTIADNDSATVTIANTTNGAEAGPANGVMTVTQTAVSSVNTVIAYSIGGTATSGSDYTALSGSVTIIAGSTTATIAIPVIDDTLVENSEAVIVTLTSVTTGISTTLGATVIATNTISDNDSATVTIANTTNGAEAGPANGVMTVTQSAPSIVNTVIAYTISGTATSGTDYTALSGTVTILAGATTATITIPVIDDLLYDPAETVIITLSSVSSGLNTSLGATVVATNTITENDVAAPALQMTKTASPLTPAVVNSTITYTFTVKNTGNVAITGVQVNEVAFSGANTPPVPANETLFSDVTPFGDTTDATANDSNWATLGPGDTVTFTASYVVNQTDIDNQ